MEFSVTISDRVTQAIGGQGLQSEILARPEDLKRRSETRIARVIGFIVHLKFQIAPGKRNWITSEEHVSPLSGKHQHATSTNFQFARELHIKTMHTGRTNQQLTLPSRRKISPHSHIRGTTLPTKR